jgi:hypothetical protein
MAAKRKRIPSGREDIPVVYSLRSAHQRQEKTNVLSVSRELSSSRSAPSNQAALSPERNSPMSMTGFPTTPRRPKSQSFEMSRLTLSDDGTQKSEIPKTISMPSLVPLAPLSPSNLNRLLPATENEFLPNCERRSSFTSDSFDIPLPLSRYRVDFEHLRELGQGDFGVANLVCHRFTGRMYVVKVSHRKVQDPSDYSNPIFREARAMAGLPLHDSLVRFYSTWVDNDEHLYIQMEYCNHGNLRNYLSTQPGVDEAWCMNFLHQIVMGLSCLNMNGIVHLDINPSNIFSTTDRFGILRFKLGDFGNAQVMSHLSRDYEPGTGLYVAPECLKEDYQPNPASDIYSLGITMFEILLGMNLRQYGCPIDRLLCIQTLSNTKLYSNQFLELLKVMTEPYHRLSPHDLFLSYFTQSSF